MRHELPSLRGAFREFGDNPPAPPIGMPFVVVCAIMVLGFLVCVARVLFS